MPEQRKRVLVLEDEPSIARNLNAMLDDLGYEVVGPLSTVDAALGVALASQLDAAILDINIGGEQSASVATALQARNVPYLLTTGYTDGRRPEFGGAPLLMKPYLQCDLGAALTKLLQSKIK